MNYILAPSLEHITLVKVAIELCKHSDAKEEMIRLYTSVEKSKIGKEWKKAAVKIVGEKMHQLTLPEPLKHRVLGFVEPVGLQILRWVGYNQRWFGFEYPITNLDDIHWTSQGTIDKGKTIKALINKRELIEDQEIEVVERYELACIYCLESDIRNLWNQLDGDEGFYNRDLDKINDNESHLVRFWSYYMEDKISEWKYEDNAAHPSVYERALLDHEYHIAHSPSEYAFQWAVATGNKAATEYFFRILTSDEKKRNIIKCAEVAAKRRCFSLVPREEDFPKECYSEVLCFLLSQMNEKQQIEIFKICPKETLKCLLDWPYQIFFLETVEDTLKLLPKGEIYYLLLAMIDRTANGPNNCIELFGEFWKKIHVSDRRNIVSNKIDSLLSKLLRTNDTGNIELILQDISVQEKEKFIFSKEGKSICEELINNSKWELLRFLVAMYIPSKEAIAKFKDEFKECLAERSYSQKELVKKKDVWDKAFQLLDDLIENTLPGKQESNVEGNCSPEKKFCDLKAVNFKNKQKL